MHKYFSLYKAYVQRTLTYRGPILVWIISNLISLVTIISVWQAAQTGSLIGGYTKGELITYFIFALFLQWLIGWFPYYWIKEIIANGEIVGDVLLKPVSFYSKALAREAGWHSVSVFVGLLSAGVVARHLSQYFVVHLGIVNLFLIAIAIVISIGITFTLSVCMGLVSFWTTRVGPLDDLFWMGRTLLGGQGIPVSFFPYPLILFVKSLPFRYMFSFPIEIYLGKLSLLEVFQGLAISLLWLGALIVLYKFLWLRGRLAYTSFGQ